MARLIAMPPDSNAYGDIFGGRVMSQMDQAGGIAAVERAQGRVVTIAVEAMNFTFVAIDDEGRPRAVAV